MAAIGCCKLLGASILRSCICPCRSSHSVPINLQDKCYSLLWNFLHLFEWENVISLRVRALAILYISGYRQHSCCSVTQLCLFGTPWTVVHQDSLSFIIFWSLLKLMPTESMMPPNHLIHCHPLLLLPSIFPSNRVSSNESALRIRWPKYWSLASASVLPMNSQDWFPLGWSGWISLQSKRLSRVFYNAIVQKHQFFGTQLSL